MRIALEAAFLRLLGSRPRRGKLLRLQALALLRSGVFDAEHYRAAAGLDGGSALTQALSCLSSAGIPPHPRFAPAFYAAQALLRSGEHPFLHYVLSGVSADRPPEPGFDAERYLSTNPDLRALRVNPGRHYLARGWREGRVADAARPSSSLPTEDEWQALQGAAASERAEVLVVMPVHKGRAETLRAIHCVLAARNDTSCSLLVINDGSPDPVLSESLERHAELGRFCLLVNSAASGFVRAANQGLREARGRDVVLLNADTEVFDFWLDRLRRAASGERIGTATPLSNAATILSYPLRLRDNHTNLEASPRTLDTLAAGLGLAPVEIPTAIGFCMLIRGACLEQVGCFDEGFGPGYGEENDFCMRARAAGWRHVAATDTFVWHWGATSFGPDRAARIAVAMAEMTRRHPAYGRMVRRFIASDPLEHVRRRLDIARIRATASRNWIV